MARWLLAACLAGVAVCVVTGCYRDPPPATLITWTDPETGKTFTVTARQTIADYILELRVGGRGMGGVYFIDDKTYPNKLSLVRHDRWLLVVNGPHVLSVYDYPTNRTVIPPDGFPFTYRTTAGRVVSEKLIDGKVPPSGLRHVPVRQDSEFGGNTTAPAVTAG
jgi:hypothetical protein